MSGRAAVAPSGGRKAVRRLDWAWQLVFVVAHIPLALFVPKYSDYATAHALLVLFFGVMAALLAKSGERVACVAAYIAGAEVYWRMRRADVPWEFGKYALVLILAIAIVRMGRLRKGNGSLGILYFLLLLPSAILTFFSLPSADARDALSFNLSGPLALAACVAFFSSLRITPAQMRWVFVCLVAPILSIAVVGSVVLQRYMPDEFQTGSMAVASGGFGPNQVSAILGLGILAAFLYMVMGTGNPVATVAFAVLSLYLFRQCVITFSRGGLYMAVGGIAAAAFYLAGDKRTRLRLMAGMALVLPVLFFVVWPQLENLTAGAIGERFRDTESTGRGLLIEADLETWAENPVLGSGPGMGGKNRLKLFRVATAHTEYSRLVAEHGIFGLAAIALLVFLAVTNVRSAPTRLEKALAASMIVYAFLSMAVDGMRLGSIGFAFGLSGARLWAPRRQSAAAPQENLPTRAAMRG